MKGTIRGTGTTVNERRARAIIRLSNERDDLRATVEQLRRIGELMSNVFFNWSQNKERFTDDERSMMKSLQTQWDATRRALSEQDGG